MNSKNCLLKQEQNEDKRVLLHSCCAICSSYPISFLQDMGYEVITYFCNPNIYPKSEFAKRLEAQEILCRHFNSKLIVEDYRPEEFFERAKGFENEPEKGLRCDKCFQLRLEQTANKAIELGIKKFTTSIVISPHKNFSKIAEIASNIAIENNLDYLKIDFKKNVGFLKTNRISRELNLYGQNYCGCKFSLRK